MLVWGGLASYRLVSELRQSQRGAVDQTVVGATWDPRGFERLDEIVKKRESDSFRDRQVRGAVAFAWPGLRSVQVSWSWLELLQGLHNPSSYEGDFSWMFSKLDTVIQNSPPTEVRFLTGLASFFYVIGRDHIGANILMQEMIKRSPDTYNVWFWSGFHAADNLKMRNLASDFIARAARFSFAPPYLSVLAVRLKLGEELLTSSERGRLLQKELEPALLEKAKQARPDWFKN